MRLVSSKMPDRSIVTPVRNTRRLMSIAHKSLIRQDLSHVDHVNVPGAF